MDDLISRQQAIDALDSELKITGRTNADAVMGYVKQVKDRLERLPSATDTNVGIKLSTNLAEVGTDCISRQAAITQLSHNKNKGDDEWELAVENDIQTICPCPNLTRG